MKSYQSSFEEYDIYITPSDLIEFTYCKRFTYYMKCLGIQQYEEKRYKVQKGRQLHDQRLETNANYLRKKLGALSRDNDVWLQSRTYKTRGKVDEILELDDGTLAPLDYKFAQYQERIYKTYQMQLALYGIMIEEVYQTPVTKGFICYCRGGFTVKEVELTPKLKQNAINLLQEYQKVLNGYYPKAAADSIKCNDCCYRNICIK